MHNLTNEIKDKKLNYENLFIQDIQYFLHTYFHFQSTANEDKNLHLIYLYLRTFYNFQNYNKYLEKNEALIPESILAYKKSLNSFLEKTQSNIIELENFSHSLVQKNNLENNNFIYVSFYDLKHKLLETNWKTNYGNLIEDEFVNPLIDCLFLIDNNLETIELLIKKEKQTKLIEKDTIVGKKLKKENEVNSQKKSNEILKKVINYISNFFYTIITLDKTPYFLGILLGLISLGFSFIITQYQETPIIEYNVSDVIKETSGTYTYTY